MVVIATAGATVALSGANERSAAAVTLYPQGGSAPTASELSVDRSILVNRLRSLGYGQAGVTIAHGTIVVTNGPAGLSDPRSEMAASPALLVRPVLCLSGPYSGSPSQPAQALPTGCSEQQYGVQPATPDGSSGENGYSTPTLAPDPALALYPTTSPATDGADPGATALLPVLDGHGARMLVGSTQLTLSSRVASADIGQDQYGNWIVYVHLSAAEAPLWDNVAEQYFHLQLAVDLDGVIVQAQVIEPTQDTFTTLGGQLQLFAQSKSDADAIAVALRTGPLPIPLRVGYATKA
jgi:hypothetical protein